MSGARVHGLAAVAAVAAALAGCTHPAAAPPPAIENIRVEPARPPRLLGELLAKPTSRVLEIGDTVYAVGSGPILISRDRGATFAPWTAPAGLCAGTLVGAGRTLYAVAARCSDTDVRTDPDKLYRSTDAGATWDDLGVTTAILGGVDAGDPRVLYAADACGNNQESCRSDDGGATWHAIAVPAPSPAYNMLHGQLFVADTGALYYTPPRDTSYELDRSDDRGATWHAVVTAAAHADIAIEAVEAGGAILGEDLDHCGLMRSVDGAPFAAVMSPPTCEPGSSIIGHGALACAVFGDDQVLASNDSGATWHDLHLAPRGAALRYSCLPTDDRLLLATGDQLVALAPPW